MKIIRSKKWVSDQMLDVLLREFEASTELSEGGLSYQRYDFRELYEILPDAFAVTPRDPPFRGDPPVLQRAPRMPKGRHDEFRGNN